ncbi:MAG: VCBS repeat-containing protein [Planctomycetes bacterium]|nr:VCBS repeat-containing protein [Planctomycetota bacterium]
MPSPTSTPIEWTDGIVAADFDGDHRDEILSRRAYFGGVTLYGWDGPSGFVERSTTRRTGPDTYYRLTVADLNEDGRADAVSKTENLAVTYLSTAAGTIVEGAGFQFPGKSFAIADFDEDGHVDLVGDAPSLGLFLRSGTGTSSFAPARRVGAASPGDAYLREADMNGDGHVDIVRFVVMLDGSNVTEPLDVLLGDGAGNFQLRQSQPTFGLATFRLADLDGDGNVDVIDLSVGVRIFAGDGTGRVYPSHNFGAGSLVSDFEIMDVDENSQPDVVTAGEFSGDVSVLFNRSRDCRSGNVHSGAGGREDALFVNGSSGGSGRVVVIPRRSPIAVSLATSSAGPASANYALWAWTSPALAATDVTVGGRVIGCAANPTPLAAPRRPQPFVCFHSPAIEAALCVGVPAIGASPAAAPFTLGRARGLAQRATITIQGVLEDAGAAGGAGFAVTNAVTLRIQ